MATDAEVRKVRLDTNEPSDETFNDSDLVSLIDELGSVDLASASVWRTKAAIYADLVNTSEGGTSHSFSDLHKNALRMAEKFEADNLTATAPVTQGRTTVSKVERS